MVEALLQAGADANAMTSDGFVPLHFAAKGGNAKRAVLDGEVVLRMPTTMMVLLEHGAAVDPPPRADVPSPLMVAVREDVDAVRALIWSGAEVNNWGGKPYSPLHLAAQLDKPDAALALIEAGAAVNAKTPSGVVPLHLVSVGYGGSLSVARVLIDAGADLGARAMEGRTPLHVAAKFAREDIATALLEAGVDANDAASGGEVPLHLAAMRAMDTGFGVAKVLLDNGAAVNPGGSLRSPLWFAVRAKGKETALLLMSRGAGVETNGDGGAALLALAEDNGLVDVAVRIVEHWGLEAREPMSLLEAAAKADAHRTLARLLERKLDPDAHPAEQDLFRSAVEHGSANVAATLIERDAVQFRSADGWLRRAVRGGSREIVEMLLQRGMPVDSADTSGRTALHIAAAHDEGRMVSLLVEYGADVNMRDSADWTPLHYALLAHWDERSSEAAGVLLASGADVDVATAAIGWTPLHLAAYLDEPAIAEVLLEAGARVNARTHLGALTPLGLALGYWREGGEVAHVLREAGGKATVEVEGLRYVPAYADTVMFGPYRDRDEVSVQENHDWLLRMPILGAFSGYRHAVRGSFTAAGAKERLVFEGIGILGDHTYDLVSLVDEDGTSRPVLAADSIYMEFRAVCLDPTSKTHTAIFQKSYSGSCCPWSDTIFMHYDPESGTLKESFRDRDRESSAKPDARGTCRWREKRSQEIDYEKTMDLIRVGELAELGDAFAADGHPVTLPTRVIPSRTIRSALKTLEALPDDVADVDRIELGESGRWEVIVVSTGRNPDYTWGGAAVVWDSVRDEWRSFYDQHHIRVLGLDDGGLIASAVTWSCGSYRLGRRCYFEIDLDDYEARRVSDWDRVEAVRAADRVGEHP